MTLAELSDSERLALAGLIRLIVKADRNYSAGEADELAELADEIGADQFWAAMDRAASTFETSEQVRRSAAEVSRMDAKELIYGALLDIARNDAMSRSENELLEWLANTWGLEITDADEEEGS